MKNAQFCVCRLFEKQSKNGNPYFVGRWGGSKVLLFRSDQTSDSGETIWNMVLQEAEPYKPDDQAKKQTTSSDVKMIGKDAAARQAAFDAFKPDELPWEE